MSGGGFGGRTCSSYGGAVDRTVDHVLEGRV